jgi:ATP-dependent DNA helicase RecG
MVFNLYARKQSTYFVNKVYPAIPVSSLRHDLMDRARRMTRVNTEHHPWVDMTDEEMLRSCGLILEDPETNKEGITLAAILLFGTDNRICLCCLSIRQTLFSECSTLTVMMTGMW